jgi:hypothetical protein
MSCIRFNTPAQRAQMAALAPSMLTPDEVAAQHPAPPVTESKIRRLRVLATDANPKIREAAASSYNTPEDLFEFLARDVEESVRACVARNTAAPCDVLRELAHDESPTVRGWVAVNYFVPADVMTELAEDDDPVVRGLVEWKASLAAESADTHALQFVQTR